MSFLIGTTLESPFEPLQPYERMNLADALSTKHFSDGSMIVQQGAPADGMYFIESGVVDVMVVGNDGTEKLVSPISPFFKLSQLLSKRI